MAASLSPSGGLREKALLMAAALLSLACMALAPGPSRAETAALGLAPNGLHVQPWFQASRFELDRDLEAAAKAGKTLAIFWEQEGCTYCKRMHEINLRAEATVAYIARHFYPIQLDMRGTRRIVDIGGEAMDEAALAARHGVNGTPNIVFFDATGNAVARLPGYIDDPYFLGVFQYVVEKGYEGDTLIAWLRAKFAGGG